ncbi:hypothetical protein D3C78_798560 [compost metagenome]
MTKRIQWLTVKVHIGSFTFDNIIIHQLRQLLHRTEPSHIQLARRTVISEQHFCNRIAKLLSTVGCIQYCRDILVNPSGRNRITADNNYHCIRIRFIDCFDQTFLFLRKYNIRSVDFFFSVKKWMITDKNHCYLSCFGSFYRSIQSVCNDVLFEKTSVRTCDLISNLQRAILSIHRDQFVIPSPQRDFTLSFRDDVQGFFYKPPVDFISRCCKCLRFA